MEKADIMEKVEGYLEEKNYLAACLYLKNEDLPDESRYELTGEVAKYVVEDLASERNKEKILYLRSVLVWLFKDIPGLASVYREQLRLASGGPNLMRDFVRGVRNFSEFGSGAETFEEKIDDVTDNLKPEVIQEKVKDFFSQAGTNFDDGIKKAQDFFDNLSRESGPSNTEKKTGDSDEPDDK
ncbi:MAG: hypothetical protein HN368_18105 [Spirochaetales bacterium]|jgi:hypothetical protein|nr:hypothetical protein [Spirochaetales bacterium]